MTESARILVTGGYGCIGAQTVKWLLANTSATVVVGSREVSTERTQRLFPDEDSIRLKCVRLDVRAQQQLEDVLITNEITHVIHLAALQTPDCNAHRDMGLQINLAGTQNLIEAIKACRPSLHRFVFASSIAIYGPRRSYPGAKVPMLAEPAPVNVYGTWKLTGEHLSRLLCQETGMTTVSIRPGVLFGPGRDAGLTAATTTAMKCVALEVPYEIPFCSRQDYLYAPDVGAAFGNAAMAPFTGYGVFTLPSHTVETAEIIDTMRRSAADVGLDAHFAITAGTSEVPFICDLDYEPFLHAFPKAPHTPLAQAIQESLQVFKRQRELGWLTR
ncbi:MAG: NAD(P)-dependent oxidoreductase [Planctomycetaceae bacterium]|nr:NAD(P)-dependent oxidoreductase [Planctomycetaceae bacterium]